MVRSFSSNILVTVNRSACRKKEQTASLVVKAVLNGFRAVDTGATLDIITVGQKKLTLLIPAGQLKHYR